MEAKDGSEALDLIRAHKHAIDAVLLDFTIPGVSSREVFEQILGLRPDVTVIVTSAYGVGTVAASFGDFHLDQFIRKPFKLVDLVRMLESALSAKTSRKPKTPNVS